MSLALNSWNSLSRCINEANSIIDTFRICCYCCCRAALSSHQLMLLFFPCRIISVVILLCFILFETFSLAFLFEHELASPRLNHYQPPIFDIQRTPTWNKKIQQPLISWFYASNLYNELFTSMHQCCTYIDFVCAYHEQNCDRDRKRSELNGLFFRK